MSGTMVTDPSTYPDVCESQGRLHVVTRGQTFVISAQQSDL